MATTRPATDDLERAWAIARACSSKGSAAPEALVETAISAPTWARRFGDDPGVWRAAQALRHDAHGQWSRARALAGPAREVAISLGGGWCGLVSELFDAAEDLAGLP